LHPAGCSSSRRGRRKTTRACGPTTWRQDSCAGGSAAPPGRRAWPSGRTA
jgi:hypothetical protein